MQTWSGASKDKVLEAASAPPAQKSRCTSTTIIAVLTMSSLARVFCALVHQEQANKNRTESPNPSKSFLPVAL
jgi:flagellar basal body-associated protein FliL